MRLVTRALCAGGLALAASCAAPHPPTATRGAVPDHPAPAVASAGEASDAEVRAAVDRALAVLWKGVEGHAEHRSCFTCHNHGAPLVAFSAARARGFAVPADDFAGLVGFVADYLDANRDRFLRGHGPGPLSLGGATDTTGWALFALAEAGKEPDAATAAAAEYTLLRDADRDHWGRWGPPRPPAEASPFMPTALAVRGLRAFGTPAQQGRIETRVAAARDWLRRTPAKDTEDRVFRLLGLRWAGAGEEDVRRAAADLLDAQRADGGWGQTDGMRTDAYATGSALAALRMGAGLPADDPAFRRGVAYLLRTQRPDGSWRVRSHSLPVQPYYETGFPHGRDQFISAAATGWAATALALACPEK